MLRLEGITGNFQDLGAFLLAVRSIASGEPNKHSSFKATKTSCGDLFDSSGRLALLYRAQFPGIRAYGATEGPELFELHRLRIASLHYGAALFVHGEI